MAVQMTPRSYRELVLRAKSYCEACMSAGPTAAQVPPGSVAVALGPRRIRIDPVVKQLNLPRDANSPEGAAWS